MQAVSGQMSLFKFWLYDEDTDHVMCRCPECGGRLLIGLYQYINFYRFCPYCGQPLEEGNLTQKRKEVYRLSQEEDGRLMSLQMRRARQK